MRSNRYREFFIFLSVVASTCSFKCGPWASPSPRSPSPTAGRRLDIKMPYFCVETNAKIDPAKQKALLSEASPAVARLLSKPESYVQCVFREVEMTFAGSDAPTASLKLESLGSITPEKNAKSAQELTALVAKHTGIDPGRIYIHFEDPPRSNYGLAGNLFG